jgi:hypothetical protein
MKKIYFFLLSLLLLSFTTVYSQKCKVGADPFTGEKVVSFDFSSRVIYYEYKAGITHLEMVFNYNGVLKVIVPKGTELLFKLENGEILKLVTIADAPPKTARANQSQYYSTSFTSDYSYVMEVSKEDVGKLAASKVVLIRYPDTQGGTLDYSPKGLGKKLADVLFKGANCLKENF